MKQISDTRRMSIIHGCFIALIAALTLVCSVSGANAVGRSFFDVNETFSTDVTHFPKWTTMVERYLRQQKNDIKDCDRIQYFPCNIKNWWAFIDERKDQPVSKLLDVVNDYANAFPYIIDQINWGMEDYWETPFEFIAINGDCEDYAITKYYTLRAMGVPADDMRVIILQDLNLGGTIHAVLGVRVNGKLMLLDNQIKQVIAASRVYHYKPIFSINEQGWWLYSPRV